MTKLGRRAIYGDTCAAAGCTAPRAVLSVRKGTPSRSRFCRRHYNADMLARHNAKHAPQPPTPTGYTVADVFALWAQGGMPPTFTYQRRRVYGIGELSNGKYRVVVAGMDECLEVDATERLSVT